MIYFCRHFIYTATPEACVTRFNDGVEVPFAREYVLSDAYYHWSRMMGYGDDRLAYAYHHEFCHSWLWNRLHGAVSPTLWAVAHGLPDPPENRDEEYLVNTVQWTHATGRRDYNAPYLERRLGADWHAILDDLDTFLRHISQALAG